MIDTNQLPASRLHQAGQILLVEGEPGAERTTWLKKRLREVEDAGGRTWYLPCSLDDGGPWAGVSELFRPLIDEIRETRPSLITRHDYEIFHALPDLRVSAEVRHISLTESARDDEKVRNFPADRAYRMVHGLIELIEEIKGIDKTPWVIACDRLEEGSHLGLRFFRELMRRRGERLGLALLATSSPGRSKDLQAFFGSTRTALMNGKFQPGFSEIDRASMARRARELEGKVGSDRHSLEAHVSELIRLWSAAGYEEKIFQWKRKALWLYPVLGYYEDALTYGDTVSDLQARFAPEDEELRWLIFIKRYFSLLALRRVGEAYELAREEEQHEGRLPPSRLTQVYYLLAMLHARYLPQKDLGLAETYLERAINELNKIDHTSTDFEFLYVFNRNGLAFVRHLQGRPQDAIELCRSGYERLIAKLDPNSHHLHKSVLIYNIAQVYAAVGQPDEAIAYYTTAMDMDPHYSEYYNERGSIYLGLGRLEEAYRDYCKAIELSPPYPEVHTNLGQCYQLLGNLPKALEEYSRALDLQPDQLLALLGRAQAFEALGKSQDALTDYYAALALKPGLWEALANCAAIQFESGNLEASATDLMRAITLEPDNPDLYLNRSIAFEKLGRFSEAASDLQTYLRLHPYSEDSTAIRARLEKIQSMADFVPLS